MSENQNQLAERPTSVKDYLALPAYRDRFHEVMGKRANQFMAAIVASSQLPGLKDAEPRSIIAAAMVAATLDLPVNPTLGQAHIVAYGDGQGNKVAQFQIGYKGLIQLALRSGQYKRLNAGAVSEGAFKGFDMVGEPILDFTRNDPTKDAAGYYCAFETLNGFIKVVYFSKEQAESHAKKFSRAYAKGYSTPWKSDFDSMATKTVIKAALGKWGLLSVEMQKAVVHDQGAQADVDSDVKYVDGDDQPATQDSVPGDPAPARPAPPARKARGAATVQENVQEADVVPAQEPTKVVEAEPVKPAPEAKIEKLAAEVPPAEAAKVVESFQQAAEATTQAEQSLIQAAANLPGPRAFLQDGEKLECEISVSEVGPLNITTSEGVKPSVKAKVKGGFVGEIYHVGGGTAGPDGKARVAAPWEVGAGLKVVLLGKLNNKAKNENGTLGKVQVFVQAVSISEEGMEA